MNDFDGIDILLVEDNTMDAEMTMRALRRSEVVNRLYWVRDGVEALEFIRCKGDFAERDRRHDLKLVLLDLKMPRLSGIDVLRELKSDPATMRIPVVMMTSSNQERDVAESYGLGANGYVTKPVQFDQFRSAVEEIGVYWLTINRAPTV